jgi:hypothetical protein
MHALRSKLFIVLDGERKIVTKYITDTLMDTGVLT